MAIIARYYDPNASKPAFEPAAEGTHAGSIVDIQDLGMVWNKVYDKFEPQIRIIIELAATNSFGKHILVSKKVTLSLHPRANLPKIIKAVTGITPTADIDVEATLILSTVWVMIEHAPNHDDPTRPYQHVTQLWKGDGSYSPSGTYRPWKNGFFPIGRSVDGKTEKSAKPFLQLYDAEGSELTRLWDEPDITNARGAAIIKCQYREADDGTIKVRKDSVVDITAEEIGKGGQQ